MWKGFTFIFVLTVSVSKNKVNHVNFNSSCCMWAVISMLMWSNHTGIFKLTIISFCFTCFQHKYWGWSNFLSDLDRSIHIFKWNLGSFTSNLHFKDYSKGVCIFFRFPNVIILTVREGGNCIRGARSPPTRSLKITLL